MINTAISNTDDINLPDKSDTNPNTSTHNKAQQEYLANEYNRRLRDVETFVDKAYTSTGTGFTCKMNGNFRFQYMSSRLASLYFHQINSFIALYSTDFIFTPKTELFFRICKELSIFDSYFSNPSALCSNGMVAADCFNLLLERIREEAGKPEFRRRIYRHTEGRKRNLASLVKYVDYLFKYRRSRLIVVRVDLSYKANNGPAMRSNQAKLDLAHLLNNMRSKAGIFSSIEGYLWKLECGLNGADHFHCIFFFNNDRHQKDAWLGEEIGKYWSEEITHGKGKYFNCNRKFNKVKQNHLCIGRIEANDNEKLNLLNRYVIKYLCKSEQQVVAKTKKRYRTIGRGDMPAIRVIRPGAPRTVNASTTENQ